MFLMTAPSASTALDLRHASLRLHVPSGSLLVADIEGLLRRTLPPRSGFSRTTMLLLRGSTCTLQPVCLDVLDDVAMLSPWRRGRADRWTREVLSPLQVCPTCGRCRPRPASMAPSGTFTSGSSPTTSRGMPDTLYVLSRWTDAAARNSLRQAPHASNRRPDRADRTNTSQRQRLTQLRALLRRRESCRHLTIYGSGPTLLTGYGGFELLTVAADLRRGPGVRGRHGGRVRASEPPRRRRVRPCCTRRAREKRRPAVYEDMAVVRGR